MSRRALSAVAAGAVTVGLLYVAARNVRFAELRPVLAGARWQWLAVMALIGVLDLAIRARRWQTLLSRSGARPAFWPLFKLEAIGLAVNNVVFLRLGEVARSALAARELSLPLATVLASVAVERALDVAALLGLFLVAAAGAPALVPPAFRHLALLAFGGAVGALVVLAFAERSLEPGGFWERRLRRFGKLHELVVRLAAGAAVLRSPSAAAQAIALSFGLWAADALVYWAAARSLGIGALVTVPRSVLVLSWAGASSALPAAPGSFGAFEAAVESILERFGAAPPTAFAYALFVHMAMYLLVTAIGLAFLYRVGLSLGELRGSLSGEGEKA